MTPEAQLENFERAFGTNGGGCVRECSCGQLYFHDDRDGYDWNEGEFDDLVSRIGKDATPLEYPAGTIVLDGTEYCVDCTCWHERAHKVITWMDQHAYSVAKWLTLEKQRKQREAENSPTIE